MKRSAVLIIYTGGTIGMVEAPDSNHLIPFDFDNLTRQVPELNKFDLDLSGHSFDRPIDSSDMNPAVWAEIAQVIESNYNDYDGFVVLHGSDTLAFTASALSFMLNNLNKPVVLTGAQLPIGVVRSDGKENLITAIEIAAMQENGRPVVPEVCIYFEYLLYRGNRTHKFSAQHFEAFRSPNYPILAEAGVHIDFNRSFIKEVGQQPLTVHPNMDRNLVVLHLFPGITSKVVEATISIPGLRAMVLHTYGAGNAPTDPEFLAAIKQAVKQGIIILNVTQCASGTVDQGRYETSIQLAEIGVVGGLDITVEAAVTKLMHLLAQHDSQETIIDLLQTNLAGEVTLPEN